MEKAIRNPFRNKYLAKQFDAMVRCYDMKHRDVVRPDGSPARGNSWSSWFWRGYQNERHNWDRASKQTATWACWRAGRAVAERESRK